MHRWPKFRRDDGPGEPAEADREIMDAAEKVIRGRLPVRKDRTEIIRPCLDNSSVAERIENGRRDGSQPPFAAHLFPVPTEFFHHETPGALAEHRIARREIRFRKIKSEKRTFRRFVPCEAEALRLLAVRRLEAFFLTGFRVLDVKNRTPFKQPEALFHASLSSQ